MFYDNCFDDNAAGTAFSSYNFKINFSEEYIFNSIMGNKAEGTTKNKIGNSRIYKETYSTRAICSHQLDLLRGYFFNKVAYFESLQHANII